MVAQKIYFVGSEAEVAHHVAPLMAELRENFEVEIAPPHMVLERAVETDLAVFYTEHFDRFRNACTELKKRRVATLYLIDGILEWRNAWENREDEPACPFAMRPVLSHKVGCIGPTQAQTLAAWGNRPKIEIVGVPRLFEVAKKRTRDVNDAKFRLLIVTAKCPGFTESQIANVQRGLSDLKNWITENRSVDGRTIEIVWRLTGGLEEAIGVSSVPHSCSGIQLAETLQNVDAVITTQSTVILEAMLAKRPVAVLDYNNCPHYVNVAWNIFAKEHIGDVISELAVPCPRKMFFQNEVLNATLLHSDESNIGKERTISLIQAMLKQARDCNEAELCFPANLLESPSQTSPARFQHDLMYPEFSEFQSNEMTELQAELAHARREIAHLNGRLKQAKSELGEAHQIFEQIHRHPIAGPVVRTRQKFLDWVATMRLRNGNQNGSSALESDQTTK